VAFALLSTTFVHFSGKNLVFLKSFSGWRLLHVAAVVATCFASLPAPIDHKLVNLLLLVLYRRW
jgi:hypothetical protein